MEPAVGAWGRGVVGFLREGLSFVRWGWDLVELRDRCGRSLDL